MLVAKVASLDKLASFKFWLKIGSFIPASNAIIKVVDRIFTRVGAVDDQSTGQSTFMVEMAETASILNQATKNSLVLLER